MILFCNRERVGLTALKEKKNPLWNEGSSQHQHRPENLKEHGNQTTEKITYNNKSLCGDAFNPDETS